MYEFLTKRGTSLSFIVGLVLIAIYIISINSGLSSLGLDTSTDLLALDKDFDPDFTVFDMGIKITVGLLFIATALLVVFGLLYIIKFPKQSLKGILGVVALVALFFVFYSSASTEATGQLLLDINRFDITEGVSKIINGGIWTTLALLIGAIGIMILGEVRNMFK